LRLSDTGDRQEDEIMANNRIYLMVDEKKSHALVKVGFTSNIWQRIIAYVTHNPEVKCLGTIEIQQRTKRAVEKQFHTEITNKGYKFVYGQIISKKTEWFIVEYNDPFYKEILDKGLNAFDTGKNRKFKGLGN
jgi:hypothetical protein